MSSTFPDDIRTGYHRSTWRNYHAGKSILNIHPQYRIEH